MAHHDRWCALDEETYQAQKEHWYEELQKVALNILPAGQLPLNQHRVAKDMFTLRTVRKFTGHLNGAIYGARKSREGRTHLDNLPPEPTKAFSALSVPCSAASPWPNLHVLQGS